MLAFSTTDRDSFEAVAKWKGRVEAECGDIALALVQNKVRTDSGLRCSPKTSSQSVGLVPV